MSVQRRQEQRLELLSRFIQELAAMDKDLLALILEFILCISILYLTFQGKAPAFLSIPSVTIIMSIDFARVFEAYNRAKNKSRNGENTDA